MAFYDPYKESRELDALCAKGLTLQDVKRCVEIVDIYAKRDDDEVAHMLRDKLFDTALAIIGCGRFTAEEAAEFAKAVLQTRNSNFSEWCA